MDTLDDVDADDDVDAELDVDALKKKVFVCYDAKLSSGLQSTDFEQEPRNVEICFSLRIFCTLGLYRI